MGASEMFYAWLRACDGFPAADAVGSSPGCSPAVSVTAGLDPKADAV